MDIITLRKQNIPSAALEVLPNPPIFFAGAAFLAAPTCPNPNLPIPIPNLSISALLRSGLVAPKPPRGAGLTGVGDTMADSVVGDFTFAAAAASAASASGS